MHKSISAGLDASLRVVDIDFDVQCARVGVDGIGIAHDGSLKCLTGKLIESQGGRGSGLPIWNSSCGAPPAPALMSAPMSVFRAVMTPAKGA